MALKKTQAGWAPQPKPRPLSFSLEGWASLKSATPKVMALHGLETVYIFAYSGSLGNPLLTAKF